jgi:hypothetical protein
MIASVVTSAADAPPAPRAQAAASAGAKRAPARILCCRPAIASV